MTEQEIWEEETHDNTCDKCGISLSGTDMKYCSKCYWEEETKEITESK